MWLVFRVSRLELGISVASHLGALVMLLLTDVAFSWQLPATALLAGNFVRQLGRILRWWSGSVLALRPGGDYVVLRTRANEILAQVRAVVYQSPLLMVVEFTPVDEMTGSTVGSNSAARSVRKFRLVVVFDSLPDDQLRVLAGYLRQGVAVTYRKVAG